MNNRRVVTGILLAALALPTMGCLSSAPQLPTSIILIIADGTGIGQHTASYYLNDTYAPARFKHVGLLSTHPYARMLVTDSGAAGTALSTGVKTINRLIALDPDSNEVKTVLEYARDKGMGTGLVSSSSIAHATPASFAAHEDYRYSYVAIAHDMSEARVDVMFGGGIDHFSARSADSLDTMTPFDKLEANGAQIINALDDKIDYDRPVVGLFAKKHLPRALDGRTPTTTQMAQRAVEILERKPGGFFLMIEESQVDWEAEDNILEGVVAEMQSLNDLVNAMLDYQAKHPDVLVILTADHEAGGLHIQHPGDRLLTYPDDEGAELVAAWTTSSHTSNFVPIFATGPGSEVFDAFIDNTFVGQKLIEYVNAK